MNKKELVDLYKPGASEHKRSDLFHSYYSVSNLFCGNLSGVKWTENENIANQFRKKEIFKEDKKMSNKINRERSLFRKLNLDSGEEIIKPTKLAIEFNGSISNDEENYFFGMSKSEYIFFLIFLFDDYKKDSQSFKILRALLNKEKPYYKINPNLQKYIDSNDREKISSILKKNLRFNSGSPNKIEKFMFGNSEIKSMTDAKNLISFQWLDYSLDKIFLGKDPDNINKFENDIKFLSNKFNQNHVKFTKGVIDNLFFDSSWEKDELKSFKIKYKKTILHDKLIPDTIKELFDRVVSRVIGGSIGSYKTLVDNHLRFLLFVGENEKGFYIKNEFINFVNSLLACEEKLKNAFSKNSYLTPDEMFEILKIDKTTVIEKNNDIKELYLKNYKSFDYLLEILSLYEIEKFNGNEEKMRICIDNHLESNKHIKGMCNASTYYEFIVGLLILQKIKNIFALPPKDFSTVIKKSLNLKFKTDNLMPYTHAPGGRPDINVDTENGSIIAEPTIQLKRQTSMEGDSIKAHVNSFKSKILKVLFVSPQIEEDIDIAFKAWKEKGKINHSVDCLSTKELINWLKS